MSAAGRQCRHTADFLVPLGPSFALRGRALGVIRGATASSCTRVYRREHGSARRARPT